MTLITQQMLKSLNSDQLRGLLCDLFNSLAQTGQSSPERHDIQKSIDTIKTELSSRGPEP